MTIRRKLTLLSLILPVVLLGVVIYLSAVLLRNHAQVAETQKNVKQFHTVSRIRASINREMKEMMEYLVSGKSTSRFEYHQFFSETDLMLQQWVSEERKAKVAGDNASAGDLTRAAVIIGAKGEADFLISRIMFSRHDKKDGSLYRYLQHEVEPFISEKLIKTLDETLADEIDAVEDAFLHLVNRSAAIPWGSDDAVEEMQRAKLVLAHYAAIDNVYAVVTRQTRMAIHYVISGRESHRQEFQSCAAEARKAFDAWGRLAGRGRNAETSLEEQVTFQEVEKLYTRMNREMKKAVELRAEGELSSAHRIIDDRVDAFMDTHFDGKMEWVLANARGEIDLALNEIHSYTVKKTLLGISLFLAVAAVICFFTYRITKGIITSIERLKQGVENLAAENFSYRIAPLGRDELGALASSFNAMSEELERSRDDLIAAKEQADRTAEQMKSMNEDLRNFNFIFFHDLRTPIVNIKGFTGELRACLKEVSDTILVYLQTMHEKERGKLTSLLHKEIPEALLFIESAVHRINGLMNSVVQLSQLGKRDLKHEQIDPKEILRGILKRLREEIRFHRAKIVIGDLPASVTADRHCMELVLGHLMENAVRYLDSARDGEIAVFAEAGVGEIVFHVKDNGRGISSADQEKIFDIFKRGGIQDVPGEGMGLAYVRTVLRRHGGRIWCTSEMGVGSIFSFTLPQRDAVVDEI